MQKKTTFIRRLDTRKDLMQTAELIEISFSPHLDPDGHHYLRQIRRAAKNHRLVKWAFAAGEWVSYPLNGFVWEENDRVVGNLSLIPFYWKRRWIVLIANVSVHPDFRRKGIARQLTQHAIDYLKRMKVASVWLHVREENHIARKLYGSFDFIERNHRDTWVSKDPYPLLASRSNDRIEKSRNRQDWSLQEEWLKLNYPKEIRWHLSFDSSRFKPGIVTALKRHFAGQKMEHFSAFQQGKIVAIATWEPSFTYADPIWLAVKPGCETVIPLLLSKIKMEHSPSRRLIINYPAGKSHTHFSQAGFELVNTLVWMEITSKQ